ncbi:hypothetical protein VNI00_016428 [Paramarasmius palmivorus]|uniref:Uncharacterized protein n=1 Tax=Paramarasmius palmivorus TaxID=297713 RepID=A0AAW0BEL6_9AGAR
MPQVFQSVNYPTQPRAVIRLPTLRSTLGPAPVATIPETQEPHCAESISNHAKSSELDANSRMPIKTEAVSLAISTHAGTLAAESPIESGDLPNDASGNDANVVHPSTPKRKLGQRTFPRKKSHKNSADYRRTKIPNHAPYDRIRLKKIVHKTIKCRWYALLNDEALTSPPPLPEDRLVDLQDHDVFLHVKASELSAWEGPAGSQPLRDQTFILIWVWTNNEWKNVRPGYLRTIDNDRYALKINNCLEPVWVTFESWKKETRKSHVVE